MADFEESIEPGCTSDSERLSRLFHYCEGEAKEVVRSFRTDRHNSESYSSAKRAPAGSLREEQSCGPAMGGQTAGHEGNLHQGHGVSGEKWPLRPTTAGRGAGDSQDAKLGRIGKA